VIKLSCVGHGRASMAHIECMGGRRLGRARLPRADGADALAGALCHAQHMTMTTPAVGRPGA
jgi:Holliday junction resolvasome RuvABC endonuclease subunit